MPPSSPSPDGKIIDDAVQDFVRGLHSDLPLRHFGEFHDQEEHKKVVEQQKERVLGNVIAKVWTRDKDEIFSLLMKVINRINKEVIAEWRTKNGEHRVKSLSFLQKWVDMICENFNMALDYQLLINPDMEIESLKNYVQRRKQVATSCFESIWKPGTAQMQEERKSKLEKQLQLLEEEIFEKRQLILESKSVDEGRTLLGEVRAILLERSRQLKCYAAKHQNRQVSPAIILKGMVEEIHEYLLTGKGSSLKESHDEIYFNLVKTVKEEIKFLTEEQMKAEDVVGYAERLDKKLRSCCFDKAQEMQQEMNGRDPNEILLPMQELLKQFKEKQPESLDLEENELDGLTHESSAEGDINSDKNGGAEPEPSSGERTTKRSFRRAKRSVKDSDSDSNETTMISSASIVAPESPPSKKQRTEGDGARRITRRSDADVEIRRRSSRLSNSHNPRRKKILHGLDLDLTEKISCDVDKFLHPNVIEYDNSIQEDKAMSTEVFEAPSSLTSSPPNWRTDKGKEDKLFRSMQMPIGSKYVVSMTTRSASGAIGNRRASSEQAKVRSVSNKSKESKSKLDRARRVVCSGSDAKVCLKNITILEGDKPKYLCLVCKRKFRWNKYLKYHGEFCGKRSSFKCDECGKGFHSQYYLDMHKRVHAGEKPFRCPKCLERFSLKWNLQRHIRLHANENSYNCKPCILTFVSSRSLHEHNLTHQEKFRFTCCYCDARYNAMNKLRKHVIIHSDERPFKCPNCEVAFAKKAVLVTHIEKLHFQQRKKAHNLAYDACVAYLSEETKNESYRNMPAHMVNSTVVNHVIKKANLRLPPDISAEDRSK